MLRPYSLNIDPHREPPIPQEYVRYTTSDDSLDQFLLSGLEVSIMLDLASRRHFGRGLEDAKRVLDFGCGCGRIIRMIQPKGEFYGCDVHAGLIEYCQRTYPHGKFYANQLMPPLIYKSGFFDLVFA